MQLSENQYQELLEALGDFVKMARLDANLTQEELGIQVGYNSSAAKQAISQIERGRTGIPNKKVDNFVQVLKLDSGKMKLISFYLANREYGEALKLVKQLHDQEVRQKTTQYTVTGNEVTETQPETISEEELTKKLKKIQSLFTAGLINQEDYENTKADLLKKYIAD